MCTLLAAGGVMMALSCSLIPVDVRFDPPALAETASTLENQLAADVRVLAGEIGERNVKHPENLRRAEDFLAASLARAGYRVRWQTYECDGIMVSNLEAELRGTTLPEEIIVVGAHYDTVDHKGKHTPGADDNASGCAGVLALARMMAEEPYERTVRFVLFVNEEPPYFWTERMGSLVYARACKDRGENIVAMLSLEMIGYFDDTVGSQSYPPLVGASMPDQANFIAFVSFASDEPLVRRCVDTFRVHSPMPVAGAAMPTLVPRIGASDHWSFWKQGYPSVMVTDTAVHRNKRYHTVEDTPETLNYESMADVVRGVEGVVRDIAGTRERGR